MVWGGRKQARPGAARGSCPTWFGTLSPSRDQGKKRDTERAGNADRTHVIICLCFCIFFEF
jgi:hypothetical protein